MAVLLGTLTTGGATDFFSAQDVAVTRRQASGSGNIDTMRGIFTVSSATSVTFVLYADSASAPGSLLGQTGAVAVAAAGTYSGTMVSSVAVTSGTFYWVGFWVGGANSLNITNNSAGGYRGRAAQASIPNPFGTLSFSDATNALPVTGEDTGSVVAAPRRRMRQAVAVSRAASR